MLGVDLAAESMAVEDRLRKDARHDAIADAQELLDAVRGEQLRILELAVERVVGDPLRDKDDGVCLPFQDAIRSVRADPAADVRCDLGEPVMGA